MAVVAEHFGWDGWPAGSRSDDARRALAAWLARRRFGYPAGVVARALGYRAHSSAAVAWVESVRDELQRTVKSLERKLTND